jgi:hypothetical protein
MSLTVSIEIIEFRLDALGGVRYWHLGANHVESGPNRWISVFGEVIWLKALAVPACKSNLRAGSERSWWVMPAGRCRSYLANRGGRGIYAWETGQLGHCRDYVDRHASNGFIFDTTQEGLIIGTTVQIN